jgi:hypothetical protein
MKKVVCPACGLVNLEKFVTFPHCAACGALILDAPAERASFWKRPVNAVLWALILGLCCAGLGVAGILTARETRRLETKTLVVYTQTPRRLRVGRVAQLRLGLDSVEEGAITDRTFQNLQLRLPLSMLKNFAIVSISPAPQTKIERGNSIYFNFGAVQRDQPLFIALRPRRAGLHRIAFSLFARDFSSFDWRGSFEVGAESGSAALPQRQKARGASN